MQIWQAYRCVREVAVGFCHSLASQSPLDRCGKRDLDAVTAFAENEIVHFARPVKENITRRPDPPTTELQLATVLAAKDGWVHYATDPSVLIRGQTSAVLGAPFSGLKTAGY